MKKLFLIYFLSVISLAASMSPLHAQGSGYPIKGTVVDAAGIPVIGAAVYEGGVVAVGGSALQATPELTWFKVDLNTGKYQMATLGGAIRLCGFNGSWSFKNNPELVYDATENAWIGVAEYSTSNFRISINDSWSYTFGPKRIEDLVLKDGADIKIYHNDIGKPIVGGDTNFKMASPGKYRFKFYYESADCTWHLSVNVAS